MKKLKHNAIILVLLSFVVIYFVLKDNFQEIVKTLLKLNPLWLIVAILSMVIYLLLKSWVLSMTANGKEPTYSFKRSWKHNLTTQFFNGITPFSTGGQPMEVYMLHKHGKVPYAKAANIIMQTFIFYQTALVLFGLLAVGINLSCHLFDHSRLLNRLILLGFFINTIVAVFLFLIMFTKRSTKWILEKGVHFLAKIHIVKDEDKTKEKWDIRLVEFHECAEELKKHPSLFLKGTLLQFLSLAFLYIIPYFIMFAMGDFSSMTAIDAIVASAYVLIIGSFVPIPGATGGIEYGFLSFFGVFLSGSVLSAMMLIWRTITYYLPMILGAIQFSFDQGDD